jgi:hypothetical protein
MDVKQIVNLKKVVVDSDLKVSLTLEFIAADRAGKERVFELIKMQGEVLEAAFEQAQVSMPFPVDARVESKEREVAHV